MPRRLRRHDEPGHILFLTISCYRRLRFFQHDSVKLTFTDAMARVRDRHAIRWLGHVIMPEHVHLLVLPQRNTSDEPVPISQILHDLKGLGGRLGKEALREVWRRDGSLGNRPLDAWATTDGSKPFWKPRGYEFNVVDEARLVQKLDYMHANPMRRGLVERAEQWSWSSFRYYEFGEKSPIAMDWDGGLPVLR